ncbi:MAG: flagellar hook-associated protein FlgK [Planctomycetes bacterium]|nr:flagellar hook-associated protein FlgK [Planctomycetota bacterium]
MSDYFIGISGLSAARKALEVIGNNIANAATEGYHRQRIELRPAASWQEGSLLFGTGVKVESVTRMIDDLLEKEILRQRSLAGHVDRELVTLRTVESALGELSTKDGGLNAAIDRFFNALQDLSAHPGDAVWQNQAVSDAGAMAGQFRTLGEFLTILETEIRLEIENVVESINSLTSQIAELNKSIQSVEIGGGHANNLRDQRDKLIGDLAELISIETQSRPYGVVDVSVVGIAVVAGASTMELEAGLDENAKLGISVVGAATYHTDIAGGKIGGLLSLKNDLVSDVHTDLDSLASAIIQQINQYHVQGVGSEGSFTELTGRVVSDADKEFADYTNPSVIDGSIFIRITDTSTGVVTREEVTVDADTGGDTLTTLKDAIDALSGVSASIVSSKLCIQADGGYKFDFSPAVLSSPESDTLNLTGTPPPTVSVSGIYTGTSKDTFTFTVSGTGLAVGNGTLQLVVTDSGDNTVATLNVGSGYAAGDKLDIGNGIKIALTTGDLVADDSFQVKAFGNTDTSGVLAAVGINTFFSGNSADDIAVCSDVSATPGRVAAALGADMTDNTNALRMAAVKELTISSLTSLTCGEFYRRVVSGVGQKVSLRQMRQDNMEQMVQNLGDRQSDISGVDISEEAAQLLVFEQMFQAMAKYISIVQSSMLSLMEVV